MSEAGEVKESGEPEVVMAEIGPGPSDATGAAVAERASDEMMPEPSMTAVEGTEAPEISDPYADACKAGAPKVALVGKYDERIPVQLTSKGHLETLQAAHPGSVEVQS